MKVLYNTVLKRYGKLSDARIVPVDVPHLYHPDVSKAYLKQIHGHIDWGDWKLVEVILQHLS